MLNKIVILLIYRAMEVISKRRSKKKKRALSCRPFYEAIGVRIREERQRKNLLQRELGEMVQLDHSVISKIERGLRVSVNIEELWEIARVLGCSVYQIIPEHPPKAVFHD